MCLSNCQSRKLESNSRMIPVLKFGWHSGIPYTLKTWKPSNLKPSYLPPQVSELKNIGFSQQYFNNKQHTIIWQKKQFHTRVYALIMVCCECVNCFYFVLFLSFLFCLSHLFPFFTTDYISYQFSKFLLDYVFFFFRDNRE